MAIFNLNTGRILAWDVREARSFGKRLNGLMFTSRFPSGCALHLTPCHSIHTFFMKFPIDVVYLDMKREIVGIEHRLPPGTMGKRFKHAVSVIELPAGVVEQTETKVGQAVSFQKNAVDFPKMMRSD